jgi:AcrR family transcriptional regulator
MAATDAIPAALRSDAARNRARIIEAAKAVFAERGLDAPTSEIAQRAGVGEATLFRRFPTKDDLVLAIIEAQVDGIIEIGDACLEEPDPWKGIERFLYQGIARQISDQGALDALKDRCIARAPLADRRKRLLDVTSALVRRGQEAGVVREDLRGVDLPVLMAAATSIGGLPFPGMREDRWRRYVAIILDGIRPEGATRLRPGPPPRKSIERPDECPHG